MDGDRNGSTHQLWLRFISGVVLIALLIGAALVTIQITRSKGAATLLTDANFFRLANRAAGERFVATYSVTGNASIYIDTGTVVVSQIPWPPGHKRTFSSDGYASPDKYLAYLFTEHNGDIIQWVQRGTNVAWCLKWPSLNSDRLKCTGFTPYIPSNGYAEESVPYVPTTALGLIGSYVAGQPHRIPPVVAEPSKAFGQVECLLQTSGTPHLTTCVNQRGIIVSSNARNGQLWSAVTLQSLSYEVSPSSFSTILKASGLFPPPPF